MALPLNESASFSWPARVPKLVHFVWIGNDERPVPPGYFAIFDWWQKMAPAHTLLLWNRSSIRSLLHHNPLYADVFDRLPRLILQADTIRYLIAWEFGGTIADLDLLPGTPLASWLPDSMPLDNVTMLVSPECRMDQVAQMTGYSIAARHVICRLTLDAISNRTATLTPASSVPDKDVVKLTGPYAFTEGISRYVGCAWLEIQAKIDPNRTLDQPLLSLAKHGILVFPFGDFKVGRLVHLHVNLWRGGGNKSVIPQNLSLAVEAKRTSGKWCL